MALSLKSLFRWARRPAVSMVHPTLGLIEFNREFQEWHTDGNGDALHHGGIPGSEAGPDPDRVAEIHSRLANIDTYWQACSQDLLTIAAWFDSLPRTQDPRSLFRVAGLSLYPGYWEVCFETFKHYKWLYVGMQFEGEELVSNTIDT